MLLFGEKREERASRQRAMHIEMAYSGNVGGSGVIVVRATTPMAYFTSRVSL